MTPPPWRAWASPLPGLERCQTVDHQDVGQGSERHRGGNGHIPMGLRRRDDKTEGERRSKAEVVCSYPSRQHDTDCHMDQCVHIEMVVLAQSRGLVPARLVEARAARLVGQGQ